MSVSSYTALADYRRRVAELYAQVRAEGVEAQARWRRFRRGRDELFRTHPQTALTEADRARFKGLDYFPYDPDLRLLLRVDTEVEPEELKIELEQDGLTRLRRIGRIEFKLGGEACSLSLFWIEGYGGGLFLPFGDRTNGSETFGGGRYLLDTIKGADLGQEGERLVLDFNFAYNPSCAYDPRWHCPLAPPENRLVVPIRAGERDYGPART